MGVPSLTIEEVNRAQGVHIKLENIEKTFGEKTVLKNLSLEIKSGEFVAIVGKSGSGKSTLLRLVAGLEEPNAGQITFNGLPIKESNTSATMMYQDSRLLPWKTVLNNVGLGLKENWKEKAEQTLDNVGLLPYKNQWPSTLSGGQQQRVALARALVHDPSLLLLDEPLSALDALTRMEMQNLIEKLWLEQGFTALLVTHDVREAVKLGDRIILIEDGNITLDIKNTAKRPREFSDVSLTLLEKNILDKIMNS
ncbi:nitrate/sulfonate/bicarbonate ABC transporter ATP-binding protein [Bacillus methanolicus PB1]|uniref:Nitrate/sulfonate/bicarbonate ABC transporter ATP-binding protein n=1 Tax=Bacillus methanolicus PB1 TaxID=997296 RepID=I3DW58_BACMT|nr:ATP-binding cassette domain-containing protein [Bacillus methanolicus]EIJ78479.1 nitrate/sulfonate/bicarbonate ABC transporter ATP-binding protein [Bacillus methanolicus PB1]